MASLRQRMEEINAEEEEDWTLAETQAQMLRRARTRTVRSERAWSRLLRRMMWFVELTIKQMVLETWQLQTAPQPECATRSVRTTTVAAVPKRRARRDDLTGLGMPLTMANGDFPIRPADCVRERLVARGGARNGRSFWWTCLGCGCRWERTTPQAAAGLAANPKAAAVPKARSAPIRPAHAPPAGAPAAPFNLRHSYPDPELAPPCPGCHLQMVPRQNRTNGEYFWGCRQFPNCRGTLPIVPTMYYPDNDPPPEYEQPWDEEEEMADADY